MKSSILILLCLVSFSFSGPIIDTLKASVPEIKQKDTSKLQKIIPQKNPTNWSKVKDLFL